MTRSHDQHPDKDTSSGTPQRSAPSAGAPDLARLSLADAAGLQHLAGNRAVSALIAQRRMAPPAPATAEEVTPDDIGAVTSGPGKPLPDGIRRRAENATGTPMSHVRMHTGAAAEASAAALQARAYTVGSDIVVGKGGADEETVLHETKHIDQQARGAVAGRTTAGGTHLSSPDDFHEREATTFAAEEKRNPTLEPAAAPEHHHPGDGHDHGSVQRVAADDTVAESSATAEARGRTDDAELAAPGELGRPGSPVSDDGRDDPKFKLSNQMANNTVLRQGGRSFWDYAKHPWRTTREWLSEGVRLRGILDDRVVKGRTFSPAERTLIRQLSQTDPEWLAEIKIGTYADAERLARGQAPGAFRTWMKQPPGTRILAASIAYDLHQQAPDQQTPTNPAYTLGRFMTTQGLGEGDERTRLEGERDAQIRKTAVDTLYPESMDPAEMHDDQSQVTDAARGQAAQANEIITNVLHVLQAGLEVRVDKEDNYEKYRGDVIRALAHGGRVMIRVPALAAGGDPNELLTFLGVLQPDNTRSPGLERRKGATHHTSISKNKPGKDGKMVEKGGMFPAGALNAVTQGPGYLREWAENKVADLRDQEPPARGATKMTSINPGIGGIGSKDWNGDVVLPNGSYGHLLLIWQPPERTSDGSLLVGLETTGMGAPSPVGYEHTMTSSEATANPESSLHGHKADKIGVGSTKTNARVVKLKDLNRPDAGWLEVLQGMQATWAAELENAQTVAEKRGVYERLVGPRQDL